MALGVSLKGQIYRLTKWRQFVWHLALCAKWFFCQKRKEIAGTRNDLQPFSCCFPDTFLQTRMYAELNDGRIELSDMLTKRQTFLLGSTIHDSWPVCTAACSNPAIYKLGLTRQPHIWPSQKFFFGHANSSSYFKPNVNSICIINKDSHISTVHLNWPFQDHALPLLPIKSQQMSHVMRKPVFAICEQQRCRSICASAQSD